MESAAPRDPLEQQTRAFLEYLGLGEVTYEPEGSGSFPDFSLGGRVAVEVTRLVRPPLSERERSPDSDFTPAMRSLQNAIESVRVKDFRASRFVDLNLNRLPQIRNTTRSLKAFLSSLPADHDEIERQRLNEFLDVDIYFASKKFETPFRLGAVSGRFLTGWVVPDLLGQCEYALHRKEEKLGTLPESYDEAWLAVGSHLTNSLSRESFDDFKELINVSTRFSRLILLNRRQPERSRSVIVES